MTKEKNNMDKFLRGSLGDLEVQPTRNVWKTISKRLLILELIRFNFTNVGKAWLYSGVAVLTTIVGLTYYNMSNESATENIKMVENNTIVASNGEQANNQAENETSKALITKEENTVTTLCTKEIEPKKDCNEQNNKKETGGAAVAINEISKEDTKKQESEQNLNDNPSESNKEIIAYAAPVAEKPVIVSEDKTIYDADVSEQESPVNKVPSRTINHSWNALFFYQQGGSKSIAPLLIGASERPMTSTNIVPYKSRKRKVKTQRSGQYDKKKDKDIGLNGKFEEKMSWNASINYMTDWSLDHQDFIPRSNNFMIKGGFNYSRFELNIGLGIRTDKSNARYEFNYRSYDSVGFFYDIDYYEIIPDHPDSIIIHYTLKPVFDSVDHQDVSEMAQRSKWVIVPIEIGYEIIYRESYVLKASLTARIGWEYYRENVTSILPAVLGANYHNIGTSSVSPFISLGFGLENQFKIYDKWWFTVEPRVYYYMKSPYKWENSKTNGPLGFGINAGIKFKF